MDQTKTIHTATYLYPGAFFPEDVTREISEPTFEAAVAAAPDEDGYFAKDRWYAVRVETTTSKRFASSDGDETWIAGGPTKVDSWIVGEAIHADDIEDNDRNRILIANIRGNSDDAMGVFTRCGNWQIAKDWGHVVTPAAAR